MLSELRSDVNVVKIDFVMANFQHAFKILGMDINKSIYLVHGDASQLDFQMIHLTCIGLYRLCNAFLILPNVYKNPVVF